MVNLNKGNVNEEVKENNGMENAIFGNVNEEVKENGMNRPTFKGAEKFHFTEDGVINDLTTEARNELIYQIGHIFDWCEIYPEWTFEGIGKMVDEWFYHKVGLLNLFVKSPFYNGNYAIEFDKPIARQFDVQTYQAFIEQIRAWARSVRLKEVKIGNFTYSEVDRYVDKLDTMLYHIGALRDCGYPISNSDVKEQRDFFTNIKNYARDCGKYKISDYKAYLQEEWDKYIAFKRCTNVLWESPAQFIDSSTEEFINEKFPDFKAKAGQKTSRVVNKLCKMMNLTNITYRDLHDAGIGGNYTDDNAYNREFAKFADACNPFAVQKHIFLSLNPVDYLTMSWGTTWGSCHDIDKEDKHHRPESNYSGCYSSGTISYMLDDSSFVFYMPSSRAKEELANGEPVPRKEMRQMFHVGKEKFIQSRLYPYDQTDRNHKAEPEDYVQYREIVQQTLAELWGVPNLWTIKKGTNICYDETNTYGTHYTDYTHYPNVNISYIKEYSGTERITIGHKPICPKCGYEHSEQDNCYCSCCREDGVWCDYHERWEPADTDGVNIEGYGWVCDNGLDDGDFTTCDRCGDWFFMESDNSIQSDRDNRYFCCDRCAERAGYYWNEVAQDYLHEDDIAYSEISNEDLPTYDMDYYDLVWAIYDEVGCETIARESDCEYIHGKWYWRDLLIEVDNEYYLPEECESSEIDGELLPTDGACSNDEDGNSDYCWAIYNSNGDLTIARVDSCEMVHGKWYSQALCVYIVSKDEWALISECVDVDGKITPIDMSEMYELDNVA